MENTTATAVPPITKENEGKPPIFRAVFGDAWDNLPPVMHKHYANRPFTRDAVTVQGFLTIEMAPIARLFAPLMKLTGVLVPYAGNALPATVRFLSEPDSDAFIFDRVITVPGKPPFRFRSRMIPAGKNSPPHERVEFMRVGIGWHTGFHWKDGKIMLDHRGYAIRPWGKLISLPLNFLFGRGKAVEEPLDENRFRMGMEIHHFLFGVVYRYHGDFTVTEMAREGATHP
jgi:hypothetical protein